MTDNREAAPMAAGVLTRDALIEIADKHCLFHAAAGHVFSPDGLEAFASALTVTPAPQAPAGQDAYALEAERESYMRLWHAFARVDRASAMHFLPNRASMQAEATSGADRLAACNFCLQQASDARAELAAMKAAVQASGVAIPAPAPIAAQGERDALTLLIESQTSIGGDWRARRDAVVLAAQRAQEGGA